MSDEVIVNEIKTVDENNEEEKEPEFKGFSRRKNIFMINTIALIIGIIYVPLRLLITFVLYAAIILFYFTKN